LGASQLRQQNQTQQPPEDPHRNKKVYHSKKFPLTACSREALAFLPVVLTLAGSQDTKNQADLAAGLKSGFNSCLG
jgi:hypothetical protein